MYNELYQNLNDQKTGSFLKNYCKKTGHRFSHKGVSILYSVDSGLGVSGKACYLR